MRTFVVCCLAVSFGATSALLAACGGPQQPPIGEPGDLTKTDAKRSSYSVCVGQKSDMFLPSLVVRSARIQRGIPKGLTPANFQAAYSLPSLTKGTGQIVAVVEVCDNPNVADDQATYRSEFGLRSGAFYKFNQYGEQGDYPPARKPLGQFIDVDVEMVAANLSQLHDLFD
jgi:hypothetical protein